MLLGGARTPSSAAPRAPTHIPALDGIRGIAVLMVMWLHFWSWLPAGIAAPGLLRRSASFGQLGVDLFFVLSGFLITRILLASKGGEGFFRSFYARRALRIFPLYFGTLAVLYLVAPRLGGYAAPPAREQLWYWVYAQNVAATFGFAASGPPHFWSLAVEEHFYLVWPLLVHRLSPRRLRQVALGLIGAALVARIVLLAAGFEVFYFTLTRMDALAAGCLLALAEGAGALAGARRRLAAATPLLAVALVSLWVVGGGAHLDVVQAIKFGLAAALFACVIGYLASGQGTGALHRLLGARPLRTVGEVSYGMYVLHPYVFGALREIRLPGGWVASLALLSSSTLAAALLCYHLYEKPFLRLKRFFATPSPRGPRGAVPSS